MEQVKLFSKMVPVGKGRTYFFDVKEAKNQEKYLAISESCLKNGTRERYRLIVFNDCLPQFTSGMSEALKFIGSLQPVTKKPQ